MRESPVPSRDVHFQFPCRNVRTKQTKHTKSAPALIPRWLFPQVSIHRVTLPRQRTPILVLRDQRRDLGLPASMPCVSPLPIVAPREPADSSSRFCESSVFVKFDKIRSFLDFLLHWQRAFL